MHLLSEVRAYGTDLRLFSITQPQASSDAVQTRADAQQLSAWREWPVHRLVMMSHHSIAEHSARALQEAHAQLDRQHRRTVDLECPDNSWHAPRKDAICMLEFVLLTREKIAYVQSIPTLLSSARGIRPACDSSASHLLALSHYQAIKQNNDHNFLVRLYVMGLTLAGWTKCGISRVFKTFLSVVCES